MESQKQGRKKGFSTKTTWDVSKEGNPRYRGPLDRGFATKKSASGRSWPRTYARASGGEARRGMETVGK